MKKIFEMNYDGHLVQVENTWFKGERLYIDGQLQDENLGISLRASLEGELWDNNETKKVKVALGGNLKIQCRIFIDNTMMIPAIR